MTRPCARTRALGTLSAAAIARATPAPAPRRTPGDVLYSPLDAKTTMARMATYVDVALSDPYVIQRANAIVAAVQSRDWPAQVNAIRQYLEHSFRFIDNPIGRQRIQAVAPMVHRIQDTGYVMGACNDAAALVAALGMANGLPARFVAYAFCDDAAAAGGDDAPFSHVIADLFDGTRWAALDVTRPLELFRLPCISRTLTFDLS